MLGTIAINISMNAMDFSLDKIHEFLLRIRFEISIPVHVVSVQLNRIDFNVMFVMNSDNIWTLCISQTVGIWEWMTLRCAKRFRKDAEQWIKMMMKHETLNRTKYSLWINQCSVLKFLFFILRFEYYLNSSKLQTVQFTIDIFHDALCHVSHSFKEFDCAKLIKMLIHVMNTSFLIHWIYFCLFVLITFAVLYDNYYYYLQFTFCSALYSGLQTLHTGDVIFI